MDSSGEGGQALLLAYRFYLSFSPSPALPTPSLCLSCPPTLPSLLPLFLSCYYIYYLVCTQGVHAFTHMSWCTRGGQRTHKSQLSAYIT